MRRERRRPECRSGFLRGKPAECSRNRQVANGSRKTSLAWPARAVNASVAHPLAVGHGGANVRRKPSDGWRARCLERHRGRRVKALMRLLRWRCGLADDTAMSASERFDDDRKVLPAFDGPAGQERGRDAVDGTVAVEEVWDLVEDTGLAGGHLVGLEGDFESCRARDSGLVRCLARVVENEETVGRDFGGDVRGRMTSSIERRLKSPSVGTPERWR